MKTLEELGIDVKALKVVVKDLNDSGLVPTKINMVAVKSEAILIAFQEAIAALTDAEMAAVPENVAKFYEALPEEAFGEKLAEAPEAEAEAEAEAEVAAGEEVAPAGEEVAGDTLPATALGGSTLAAGESLIVGGEEAAAGEEAAGTCPSFGTGWTKGEPDCVACEGEFAEEYAACKDKSVAAKAASGKKKKDPKAPKEPKAPKAPKEPKAPAVKAARSRYGSTHGTMGAAIDELLWNGGVGVAREVIILYLMANFGRDRGCATNKLKAHLGHLKPEHNVDVDMSETPECILKAMQEYADGYTAENASVVALAELPVPPPVVVAAAPEAPAAK